MGSTTKSLLGSLVFVVNCQIFMGLVSIGRPYLRQLCLPGGYTRLVQKVEGGIQKPQEVKSSVQASFKVLLASYLLKSLWHMANPDSRGERGEIDSIYWWKELKLLSSFLQKHHSSTDHNCSHSSCLKYVHFYPRILQNLTELHIKLEVKDLMVSINVNTDDVPLVVPLNSWPYELKKQVVCYLSPPHTYTWYSDERGAT